MQRYYYGWNIVGMAVLANTLVVGSTFSSFSLFVKPVSAEFHLSRADMNTALILTNIGTAVLAPFVGRILDRFSVRRVLVTCILLLGGSLIALGLSRSLWLSAAVMAAPVAAGALGAGSLTFSVLLARWFVAQRGRAMALAAVGMSLGHVAVAPVVGALIESQGWRNALLMAGGGLIAILLTLSLFVRERPGAEDVEGGRGAAGAKREDTAAAPPLTVGQILRMPQFWCIGVGSALGMAVVQALLATMAPLAMDGGLSMAQAASLVSFVGMAAIGGKLVIAVIADKVDKLILFTGFLALGAVMNAGLLVGHVDYVFLAGCAVLVGLTSAALAPILYALLADRFGASSFGTVRGLAAPIGAVLSAIALRVAGEIYDRTGGYDLLFTGFIAVQLVAASLMFATRFTSASPAVRPAPAAS